MDYQLGALTLGWLKLTDQKNISFFVEFKVFEQQSLSTTQKEGFSILRMKTYWNIMFLNQQHIPLGK